MLTAAHCVQDKESGALCENFLFERCYDEGESVETLTFKTVALKSIGIEQKEWKWDYAFAISRKYIHTDYSAYLFHRKH